MINKPLYTNQLLHIFSNIDMVNALCTIHSREMKFSELQDNTSIPKSTLEQQLKRLVTMELVTKTRKSNSCFMYKSNVLSFSIFLDGELVVNLTTKDNIRYVSNFDGEMEVVE